MLTGSHPTPEGSIVAATAISSTTAATRATSASTTLPSTALPLHVLILALCHVWMLHRQSPITTAHRRHHPSGRPFPTIGKKQVRATGRAEIQRGNVPRRHARVQQLPAIGIHQVERNLLRQF